MGRRGPWKGSSSPVAAIRGDHATDRTCFREHDCRGEGRGLRRRQDHRQTCENSGRGRIRAFPQAQPREGRTLEAAFGPEPRPKLDASTGAKRAVLSRLWLVVGRVFANPSVFEHRHANGVFSDHKIQGDWPGRGPSGADEGRPVAARKPELPGVSRSYAEFENRNRTPTPRRAWASRSSCDGRSGITAAGTGLFRGLVVTKGPHGDSDRGRLVLVGMGDRGITGHGSWAFGGWNGARWCQPAFFPAPRPAKPRRTAVSPYAPLKKFWKGNFWP